MFGWYEASKEALGLKLGDGVAWRGVAWRGVAWRGANVHTCGGARQTDGQTTYYSPSELGTSFLRPTRMKLITLRLHVYCLCTCTCMDHGPLPHMHLVHVSERGLCGPRSASRARRNLPRHHARHTNIHHDTPPSRVDHLRKRAGPPRAHERGPQPPRGEPRGAAAGPVPGLVQRFDAVRFGIFQRKSANFRRLVLFCIEADFCNQILIF